MIKIQFRPILLLFLCFMGISLVSPPASAEVVDAYAYVTSVCATSPESSYWKDGLGAELKNMGTTFVEGLIDITFKPQEFAYHLTQDPYTVQMRSLILSEGFLRGIHDCYPNSEIKRNLLALRIIFSSSLGYSAGAGAGFIGGLKLFSIATKALGSTALPVLRYLGLSDRALIALKKAGVLTGFVVVGGVVYVSIDEAIARYQLMHGKQETMDENQQAITELKDFQNEILELIPQESDPAVQAQLQQQLNQIQKNIEQRQKLSHGEQS